MLNQQIIKIFKKEFRRIKPKGEALPKDFSEALLYAIEQYFDKLYLDINIALPPNANDIDKESLLGLCILALDWELQQNDRPNYYKLVLSFPNKMVSSLNDISEVDDLVEDLIALTVDMYYKAHKDGSIEKLDEFFHKQCLQWLSTKYVAQEMVFALTRKYTMPEVAEKTGFSESTLVEILNDYDDRIKLVRYRNLILYIDKIKSLIDNLTQDHSAEKKWLAQLLYGILSGGKDIESLNDLLPDFHNSILDLKRFSANVN